MNDQAYGEAATAQRWWTGAATLAAAGLAAGLVLVGASAHPGPVRVAAQPVQQTSVSSMAVPTAAALVV